MSDPNIREVVESYATGLAEARQQVGNRAVALSKLQKQLAETPHTVDGLMEEFDFDRDEATKALERLTKLEQMVGADLQTAQQQICYLDQGIRQRNNPKLDEFTRLMFMKNYLRVGTNADPIGAHEAINWTSQEREARNQLHDKYQTGMLRVGYGTARFVGSMTGATDMIALVYGVSDEGKPLGWEMRAAALLSLVGGALLSDAATTAHVRNVVANRSPTPTGRIPRNAADAPDAPDAPKVATSQTSNLPSGTEADLAGMGIPQANFDKMQAYLFENNGHVALRPTGVDAVDHLEAGAKPKPVDFKSKTSKGVDGLLGADPTKPGCAAAFDPKTDFFDQAMRSSGMNDADVAARLDAIKAGQNVDPPTGFNASTWSEALERYKFRKGEWDGAIGDGVRKMVEKGDYELREGIIWEVDGPNGPRPVTGDHDPFELWIEGRPATAAEEAAFIRTMSGDNAGVVHGGHIRFDPQPADYGPGGRFDLKLDPDKYTPAQIEQKVQAKYEADRNIYEVIMDKHSRQALSDDVLRNMEGFEPPARSHYPDGPYGDLRMKQDTELHQRWQDLQAGRSVDPEVTKAEVLVLIGPTGKPVIMRAGETPAGVPKLTIRPVDIGPVKPGSTGTLPRQLLFYGSGVLKTDPISYDDGICDWYDEHARLTAGSEPMCACENDGVIAAVAPPPAATSSPIWKVLVGVVALVALAIGAIVVFAGGDDGGGNAAVADPVVEVADTERATEPEPEPSSEPPPVTEATEPPAADPPAAAPDPVATGIAIAHLCGVTTHSSASAFPASPSYFLLTLVLLAAIAAASGIRATPSAVLVENSDVLDGATVTVQTPGADIAEAVGTVNADGVVELLVPISSFGPYSFPSAVVTAIDGTTLPVIDPVATVVVEAAEGPMGGCIPSGDLTADQRGELAALRFPPVAPEAAEESASVAAPLDLVDGFVAELVAAHGANDTGWLVEHLHPAVIDRYGASACDDYIADTVGGIESLLVVESTEEPWDFPFEGQTTDVPDSITVTADGVFGGDALTVDLHVAPVGDDLAWFANCTAP